MKKFLNKKELCQILDQGWSERREKSKERRAKNSQRAKDWKARELKVQTSELTGEVERQKHYLFIQQEKIKTQS